jgi:hypothetical protein
VKRGVAIAGLVLALGVGVVAWWWRTSDPVGARTRGDARRSDSVETSAAGAAGAAPAREGAIARERDDPPPAASTGVAIEPTPARGLALRIVERATGAPKPAALVTRIDPFWYSVPEGTPPDLAARLDVVGRRFRADEQGCVRIPRSRGALIVFARSDGEFGYVRIEPEQFDLLEADGAAPRTIAVGPPRTLRVQVVDPDGTPRAGIPIRVDAEAEYYVLDSRPRETRAPDGIAEVPAADLLFEGVASQSPVVLVRLDFPLREGVSALVERGQLDGPPIRLVLPPTGRIDVSVVDSARALGPGTGARSLSLRVAPSDSIATPDLGESSSQRTLQVENGRGHVDPVELGLLAEGDWWFEECNRAVGSARGPTRPAETTELRLVGGDPLAVITGTVIDAQGAPVAKQRLQVKLLFRSEQGTCGSWGHDVTGADGSFRFTVPEPSTTPTPWDGGDAEFRIEKLEGGFSMHAAVAIGSELARRGGSLGRVVLSPCGRIASGIVVDQEGVPVAQVAVFLQYRSAWKTRMRARPGGQFWNDRLDEWYARSDSDGRFEMFGDPGEGEFELVPRNSQFKDAEPVQIELGATDVRLVLRSWACLVAHVELDPGISHEVVWALARVPTQGANELSSTAFPDAHGDLVWRQLAAGRARLVLHPANCFAAGAAPLFRADDLVLEEGRVTRLEPIDLRGRFTRSRIELVDAAGAPVREGEVEEIAFEGSNPTTLRFERGVLDAYCRGVWPEARVRAAGFRTARVTLSAPLTRVVLRGGIRLRIEPGGDALALPPDRELQLTLARLVGDSRYDEQVARVAGKPIDVVLREPGRYEAKLTVVVTEGESRGNSNDVDALTKTFDVADADDVQVVPLRLDASAILAASHDLGGR